MTPDLRRWLLLLRVPLVLLGIFLFFALYNRLLLDKNLQNLRTSLSVMDSASGVGQAEAALLLVDQTLTAQMAGEEMDLRSATTLQYAQGALSSDQMDRPPDDAQVLLEILGEEKRLERPALFRTLDGMISSVQASVRQAALLPRQVLGKPLSPEIDTARQQEAARLEKNGRFSEAASLYQGLLADYPGYEGRSSLKLRLGHLFQRSNDFSRAQRLYKEALAETRDPKELVIARQMLDALARLRAPSGKAKKLEQSLARAGPADRQRAAFQLGGALIQAASFDPAAKAFRESFLADPEGKLAPTALFKEAWCLRTAGRLEEAFSKFSDILRRQPDTDWAVAATLQIAEIYKATGDLRAAAATYERATSLKGKDAALTAIAYAQAGSAYLFDLNDVGKGQALLRDLAKRFPASGFSSVGRELERLRARKDRPALSGGPAIPVAPTMGPAPALPTGPSAGMFTAGSPLVNWLESFLPVFVSVFSDRLVKYMEAVGETDLARRFTETEFQELVLREVQRRFPSQVTDVQTKIHPDGFVGSGTVHLGLLKFSVEATIGIAVQNYRAHAVLQNIKIGKFSLPDALLKLLETRINTTIDQTKYSLKIKEYKLNEGYAWISVEVAD